MHDLDELAKGINGFSKLSHTSKIKIFAWYIHQRQGKERFEQKQILNCYNNLNLAKPSNISQLLLNLINKKPSELMRDTRGYYLERGVRERLDAQYGQRATTISIHKLLEDLPSKIPDVTEKGFLSEALICFKNGAFRASIIMCWNLALDHLCNYVLKNHLVDFNTQLPKSYPKARVVSIVTRESFFDMQEAEILQVCRSANIITSDQFKILKQKLDRRNTAAHPNNIVITQLQAEDVITDLINNIVLKMV
jgi:hypothetical protein